MLANGKKQTITLEGKLTEDSRIHEATVVTIRTELLKMIEVAFVGDFSKKIPTTFFSLHTKVDEVQANLSTSSFTVYSYLTSLEFKVQYL